MRALFIFILLPFLSHADFTVTSVKKIPLFLHLGLKKQDRVIKLNNKKVTSQSDFIKLLKKSKTKIKNKITVKRKKSQIFIYYTKTKNNSIRKKYYKLVSKTGRPHIDVHELSKKEAKFLLKRLSKYQRGRVTGLNAFVYKKPNFDSKKLGFLPTAVMAVLSKKIYVGPHQFGTFYKVFYSKSKKKKLIGFISEVDVTPEFTRNKKKNPEFAKAEDVVLSKTSLPQKQSKPSKKPLVQLKKDKLFFVLGPSFLLKVSHLNLIEGTSYLGLRAGIYKVLHNRLNLDVSLLSQAFINPSWLYLNLTPSYRLINRLAYSLHVGWGFCIEGDLLKDHFSSFKSEFPISFSVKTNFFKNIIWTHEVTFSPLILQPSTSKNQTSESYPFSYSTSFTYSF